MLTLFSMRSTMPGQAKHHDSQSPVGTAVADDIRASLDDVEVQAEHERLAPFEGLARLVIMRRAVLGVSQKQLAAISRIESGQHATNARTLIRLAEALDARAILGFEYGPTAKPQRELVVL